MSKTSIVKRGIPCFLAIILIISMGMSLLNGFYTVQASLPDIDSGRTNIDTPQADCGGTQQNTPLLPENDNNNLDDPQVDQATPQHDVWPPEEDDDNEPREYDRYDDGDDNRDYPLPPHPPWPPSPPPGNGSPYINKKVRNPACGNWQDDINADVGDTVTFKITITPGTRASNMRNIQVKDWLPSGISFVSSDPQPTDIQSFNGTPPHYPPFPPRPPRPPLPPKWPPYWPPNSYSVLSWNLAGVTLNKGESTTITVTGKIQGCCCCCCEDLKNIAEVDAKATTYANGCNNPRPNTDIDGSDSAYVNVDCEPPNINIQKKVKTEACGNWVEHTTVGLGDTVEFRIALTNTADYALNNVLLRDQLPLELDYVSANPTPDSVQFSLISWRFDMAAQETKYFYVTAEANAVTELATNNAYVDYNCCIHKNDTATVTIVDEGNPDFTIDKKVKENCCGTYQNSITVDPEQWVTFKITVTNTGDVPLDITIQDQLPTEFTYNNNAEVNGIPTEPTINNNIYTWELTNIALQETTIITFQATPNECGTHTNTATATTTYQSQTITKQDTANVTVPCEPDVTIDKYVKFDCSGTYQKEVAAEIGDYVVFKLIVRNTGDTTLDITVRDELPAGLSYHECYTPFEPEIAGNMLYWNFTNVPAGETRLIKFRADVEDCGTHINYANVTAEDECYTKYDEDQATVIVDCEPNITIDKQVKENCCGTYQDSVTVDPGQWLTFKITATNDGDTPLTVTLVDKLPVGITYTDNATVDGVPHEPDDISYPLDGTVHYQWNIGQVDPQETVTLIFTATADTCGSYTNIANVTGSYNCETVYAEDTATIEVLCEPSITVDKLVKKQCSGTYGDQVTVGLNDIVTFKIVVENTGETSLDVTVVDTLPSNLIYADNANYTPFSNTSSVIEWQFEGVEAGEIIEITFDARAVSCECGVNTAEATGYYDASSVSDSDDATVIVSCDPDVSIEKYVKLDCGGSFQKQVSADIGDYVVFKLLVTNDGDTSLDVSVRDELPVGLTYNVCYTPFEPEIAGNMLYWNFTNVPAGETRLIKFRADVEDCGTHINYANVTAEDECYTKYDEDQATVIVDCEPNITIDKQVKENCCGTYQNSITVDPEQWVTFKITVTNTGDVPLDITIQDQLPTEFTYNNNAEVNGIPTEPTINNNIYTWELTNIALQETTIITFQATPNECGTHTNTATATTTYQSQTITKQDTANVTVHCDPDPDLSIEKKVSLDGTSWLDHVSAEVDSLVSFRINVTNTGNIDLLNVTVFDDFNNSVLAYVEDSANYEPSSVTDHLIKWRHVDLAVGESRVIRFDATIVGAGTGINNASGVILAEETGGSIIMVYDMVTVTGTMPGILDVDKTVWDDGVWSEETEADIGDTVRFNISITNNGPGPYGLYDMYVNDTLPGILVYNDTVKGPDPVTISGDNRNISWLLFDQGMLEPGETFSLEFTADVVAEGRQYNVVNVSSEYCDPDPSLYYDEDTAAVDAHGGETSVAVNKLVRNQSSDWQNEVTAGYLDVVRFNITVTNTGSTLLTTINVNDTLPEALGYLGNATVNGETRDPNVITSSVIMWELTDGLSSGEQLFIEFDAEVNQNEGDQTVENQVIVVAENESTGQVTPDVSDAALVQLIEQNDSVAPTSSVEAISPDIQSAPIGVTATATDDESGVHNVTLYYCHSHNQIAPWGEWMKYDTDSVDADGWSWSFDAPNGTGYYRFYSRAADNAGNIEESKDDFEASVRVVAENIEVSIEKPKGCCFYVNDNEVCKTLFGKTRIVGPITVEAVTNDVVTLVEFYVDDELVGTDENAPFAYTIDDRLIGKHVIKVVAHGSNENSAEAEVTAHIFNLGGSSDSEEGSSQALNTHRGSQSAVSSDSEAKAISTHTVVSNGKANKAVVCKNTNRNINNKLFISNRI